jgi:hypothetical protein
VSNARRPLLDAQGSPGEQHPAPALSRRAALWVAARQDWATATVGGRLMLVAALAALMYEWSSGNETFSSLLAAYCLRGRETVGGVLFAGGIVGSVVAVQQIVSGSVLLAGIRHLPRLFEVLTEIVQAKFKDGVPGYRSLPFFARIPISFFMGASFVVTEDAIAGERQPRRSVLLSAATAGATLFMLVGVFGGAVVAAHGTPFQRPAKVVLAIVSDWRVWATIILVPPLAKMAFRRVRRRWSSGS